MKFKEAILRYQEGPGPLQVMMRKSSLWGKTIGIDMDQAVRRSHAVPGQLWWWSVRYVLALQINTTPPMLTLAMTGQ